jgi:hypothetical protein
MSPHGIAPEQCSKKDNNLIETEVSSLSPLNPLMSPCDRTKPKPPGLSYSSRRFRVRIVFRKPANTHLASLAQPSKSSWLQKQPSTNSPLIVSVTESSASISNLELCGVTIDS